MAPMAGSVVSIDDAALVESARAGDMNAFSRLVTKYQDRVLNTCWRMTGRFEDAQDLTQETFLHALEAIGTFRRQSGFYTWLFRIAVNLSISHCRRRSRTARLALHMGDGECNADAGAAMGHSGAQDEPSARMSARETQQLVLRGLEQLEEDQRALIVLRDIESFDYRQIADILELPVGTVKSRLHRARMELRDRLKPLISGI
ncbi:MAG: DNA-directed RNA polymerase sigma-70 factor [Phycisphaerae bacterium]